MFLLGRPPVSPTKLASRRRNQAMRSFVPSRRDRKVQKILSHTQKRQNLHPAAFHILTNQRAFTILSVSLAIISSSFVGIMYTFTLESGAESSVTPEEPFVLLFTSSSIFMPKYSIL